MSVIALHRNLERTLRQNGMQAYISFDGGRYNLVVQGHDAPVPTVYPISQTQVNNLANGGNNTADKRAYNEFVGLVRQHYKLPNSWVAARNAMSSISMGQHAADGTRFGIWNRHYPGYVSWHPIRDHRHPYAAVGIGIAPIGMNYHTYGAARNGNVHGRLGETGFYWKGAEVRQEKPMELNDAVEKITVKPRPRPQEPAVAFNDTSKVYFSKEHWEDVLNSHGIVIDAQNNTMTILSKGTDYDKQYVLTDDEKKRLLNGSIDATKGGVTVADRLAIINGKISQDYSLPVTLDMLKSTSVINIPLNPEVKNQLDAKHTERYGVSVEEMQMMEETAMKQRPSIYAEGVVNGRNISQLNEIKGWYKEGSNGREVSVGQIWVEAVPKNQAVRQELEESLNVQQEEQQALSMPQVYVNENGVAVGKLSFDEDTQKPEPISLDTFGKEEDRPLGGQMDDILSSHGINNLFRTGEIELTYNGGRYFNDEKTFALPEDVADIVYSNDEKVTVKERLDALNTVIGEHLEGGGVTEEMLRSDKNIPVLGIPEEKRNYSIEVKVGSKIVAIPLTKEQAAKAEQNTLDLKKDVKLEKSSDDKYKLTVKVGDQTFEKEVPRADIGKDNYKKFRSEDIHDVSMSDGKKTLPYLSQEQISERTYMMSAIIDGEKVSKEITAKQYQEYLRMDDYHRMKMMGKLFGDVDVKTRPEMKVPFIAKAQMVFDGLRMGLDGLASVAHGVAEVNRGIYDINHPEHVHHHHNPEVIAIKGPVLARNAEEAIDVASKLYAVQTRHDNDQSLGRGI